MGASGAATPAAPCSPLLLLSYLLLVVPVGFEFVELFLGELLDEPLVGLPVGLLVELLVVIL
jgi:hypothetical protein